MTNNWLLIFHHLLLFVTFHLTFFSLINDLPKTVNSHRNWIIKKHKLFKFVLFWSTDAGILVTLNPSLFQRSLSFYSFWKTFIQILWGSSRLIDSLFKLNAAHIIHVSERKINRYSRTASLSWEMEMAHFPYLWEKSSIKVTVCNCEIFPPTVGGKITDTELGVGGSHWIESVSSQCIDGILGLWVGVRFFGFVEVGFWLMKNYFFVKSLFIFKDPKTVVTS